MSEKINDLIEKIEDKIATVEGRLSRLERLMRGMFTADEKETCGSYENSGFSRAGAVLVLAAASCIALTFGVIGANETVWNIRNTADDADVVKIDAEGDMTVNSISAVTVGATGNATVGGTLGVTGVATFTAIPKVTVTNASGSATAVMTNAPAINEQAPIWIKVTYGTNTYVIPAWDLD